MSKDDILQKHLNTLDVSALAIPSSIKYDTAIYKRVAVVLTLIDREEP